MLATSQEDVMNDLQAAPEARTWKAVYTIVERGPEKKYWVRIGTAFVNRDHSINVKLDASPTNGQLHIRDADPLPERLPPRPAREFSSLGDAS